MKKKKQLKKKQSLNRPKLVFIGLGNLGYEYHKTRHNVGFMVIDKLAHDFSLKFKKTFFKNYSLAKWLYRGDEIILIKPLTYMNRSGVDLPSIARKYIGNDTLLVVICDNMDLAYGECRVKMRGSNLNHNGISSIVENYGSSDFIRIYIGISRPSMDKDIVHHVLGEPSETDLLKFIEGVERGASAAVFLLTNTVERVMNEYNRKNNQNKSS